MGFVIYGSLNQGDNATGGGNTITNHGEVTSHIVGSYNKSENSNGGENIITNYGLVGWDLYGSFNEGDNTGGGGNTITNYGTVTNYIIGSYSRGENSNGGENIITNYGTVSNDIYGTVNWSAGSNGGENTITNYGTVKDNIIGSYNAGDNSYGGGNRITNYGTVNGDIIGSHNTGNKATSTGNIIANYGTVGGNIYGSLNSGINSSGGNDIITNGGTVGGSILAGDGNDRVIMETGPDSVGGLIDGGADTDIIVYKGGTWTQNHAKVLNFEDYEIIATQSLILAGAWDMGDRTVQVDGGSLTVDDTLSAGGLAINSGSAVITGRAVIGGAVYNAGALDIGGSLRAGSLTNSGTAYLRGSTVISGRVANSNLLDVSGSLRAGSLSNTGFAAISGIAEISGDTGNPGRMTVNGSLTTARLTNSGYLGGTGTIHADIINTGVLSPGNSIGTLTIASSLVFEPGSTLVAELDCTCLCDLLSVSGPVAINGGTVSTSVPKALYADGHAWTIISADQGVTGQFDTVDHQLKSEVLSFGQKNTGDALNLVISRKSYGAFASGGAADAGRGLDRLVPLASGDMENFLLSMDYDMTADQISQIVNALNPEMYTAFSAASLKAGRLFDRAMGQRLTELGQRRAYSIESNRAAGNGLVQLAAAEAAPMAGVYQQAPRGWGMWGRAMGLWADQKETDGYLGRGQTTGGAAIGADYMVSDKIVLGFAVGATRTDLSWSHGNYSGDIDAMHTGLYAQAGFSGFFTRATASYARLANSATRPVSFEGFDANAKADFDANLYAAGLALGYQARFGDWLLEPVAGLDYQHLREDGFSENGAGLFSYDIASRDTDSALFSLGLNATRRIQTGGWDLLPRLGISWQHQFGDDRPSLDASFMGYGSAPFTVSGAEFPSDLALVEAGLSLAMRPGLDFFADYSLAVADGYHTQTLTAGLKYSF